MLESNTRSWQSFITSLHYQPPNIPHSCSVQAFKFVCHLTFLHNKISILLTFTLPPERRISFILPPESREIVVGNIKWRTDLIDDGSVGLNMLGGHSKWDADNSYNSMTQWVTVSRWRRRLGSALPDLASDLKTDRDRPGTVTANGAITINGLRSPFAVYGATLLAFLIKTHQ